MLINRRLFVARFALLPITVNAFAESRVDSFFFDVARPGYFKRIDEILRKGKIPIIDIESSYDPTSVNLPALIKDMDLADIAQICLSADYRGSFSSSGAASFRAYQGYPSHIIPTGIAGGAGLWSDFPERFQDENEKNISKFNYPLMGEFEFNHYPSPRQLNRNNSQKRYVDFPINSEIAHRIFRYSAKTALPFQIHYEIEDSLLKPLEEMLIQYPSAKVIWCHMAQIRYQSRSTIYSPQFIANWLEKYPNLYLDTAFGGKNSFYPASGEYHSRFWQQQSDWIDVIEKYPYRFLAALDLGADRMNSLVRRAAQLREFIDLLPIKTQHIVAYKAAWKLVFNEDL